jgi:hypothetical protein
MDLIGQESLYGSGSAAHEDQLHIEPLALVKTFFSANHHRQNLDAGRRKRAAHRLTGSLIDKRENTDHRDENTFPHNFSFHESDIVPIKRRVSNVKFIYLGQRL